MPTHFCLEMPCRICWRAGTHRVQNDRIGEKSMQNANDDVIEIDLKDLFGFLLHWLWLIIICGIAAGVAGYLISTFAVTPLYKSTTTIYILSKQENNSNLTYSDLQLGSQLTMDYALLIKSRTVLEQAIETYQLEIPYEQFANQVDVETVTNTRSINITVTNPDPSMAKLLADEIREIAAQHITSVTDVQAVNLVDAANLPERPSSPKVRTWTLVAMLIGLFLCTAVLTVRFLLDDTIKSSEDVEKYLGLSTLAMIPVAESSGKGRTRSHGRQGSGGAERHSDNEYGNEELEDLSDEMEAK